MTIIAVIILFTLFILGEWVYMQFFEKKGAVEKKAKPTIPVTTERYYHPGHTWVELKSDDGTAEIGTDSFTRKIMGSIEQITLPQTGQMVQQGSPLWTLSHGTRRLTQISPVSGKVVEVNGPEKNKEGWLVKIKPVDLRRNLNNLLHGDIVRYWQDWSKTQFVLKFTDSDIPVYQDGGELRNDVSEIIPDSQWEKIQQEFFYSTFKK